MNKVFLVLSVMICCIGCKENRNKDITQMTMTVINSDTTKSILHKDIELINPKKYNDSIESHNFDFKEQKQRYSKELSSIKTDSDIKKIIIQAASESNLDLLILVDSIYGKRIAANKYYFMLDNFFYLKSYSRIEVFSYLLKNELLLSSQQIDSIKLTMRAIENKEYNRLQKFLDLGMINFAEFNVFDEREDPEGCFYLNEGIVYTIFEQDDTIALRILLETGYTLKNKHLFFAKNHNLKFVLHYLSSSSLLSDEILYSVFRSAISFGDIEKVESFLEIGLDIEKLDSNGRSMLYYSIDQRTVGWPCCGYPTEAKYLITEKLIKRGAKIDVQDKNGISPIMLTSQVLSCGGITLKTRYTELLLDKGASLDLTDNRGQTFWDYILKDKNFYYIRHFSESDLIPNKYKSIYDSIYNNHRPDRWDTYSFDKFLN